LQHREDDKISLKYSKQRGQWYGKANAASSPAAGVDEILIRILVSRRGVTSRTVTAGAAADATAEQDDDAGASLLSSMISRGGR